MIADFLATTSVKIRFVFLIAFTLVGLIVFVLTSQSSIDQVKISGPLYQDIAREKELLTDLYSSPLYLVEAQLAVAELCLAEQDAEVDQLIKAYQKRKSEFRQRFDYWKSQDLTSIEKSLLIKNLLPGAQQFFDIVDLELIPAVKAGDRNAAIATLRSKLEPVSLAHRKVINEFVNQVRLRPATIEDEAVLQVASIHRTLWLTGIVLFVTTSLLATYIFWPTLVQMPELVKTLESIAAGNFTNQLGQNGKGEFRVLATAIDTTIASLVDAKLQAESASSTKTMFLANMSHEIRTPMTAILGYCDILHDEGSLDKAPPERLAAIRSIRMAGKHLLEIINDILDLSKIEVGNLTTEVIPTSARQIVVEVAALIRPRLAEKNVLLSADVETGVPDSIMSDPTRLRQILMNLVGNASKFTESGRIDIRCRVVSGGAGQMIQFEVEDTGIGMTAEQAATLFRPFTQADLSVTRKFGGTGLGLTISQRLAQLMGGDLVIGRTGPGEGSMFVMQIPLVVATKTDSHASSLRLNVYNPNVKIAGRILLAEDGPDNQKLISFFLSKAGAEVEIAENGEVALRMLDTAIANGKPYQLLVTDLQMPKMDGYTLAKRLRERGEKLPIIALTAHAMSEDRDRCLESGFNDYASKPICRGSLIEICRIWLNGGPTSDPASNETKVPAQTDSAQNSNGTMQTPPAPTSPAEDILQSEFRDDPDVGDLIYEFLGNLGPLVSQMMAMAESKDLAELSKLAHQLKGAAGGYGYPSITDAAKKVELQAKANADHISIVQAMAELNLLAVRAIAGRWQYESEPKEVS